MKREDRERLIHRILVALDASPHSLAALQAATELASRFEAELVGLYVEDVNVLRLAGLPFVREVGLFSARSRRVRRETMDREMRAHLARARRLFRRAAARAQVQAMFRVARGVVASEVLSAARDSDVLILGRAGWTFPPTRRWGSTARSALVQAPGLTLVLQDGTRLGYPIFVLYDGSPLAHKSIDVALSLLADPSEPLTVILMTDGAPAENLRAEVRDQLRPEDYEVHFRSLEAAHLSDLSRLLCAEICGTLVLPARPGLFQDEVLQSLLEAVEVPVLLVR